LPEDKHKSESDKLNGRKYQAELDKLNAQKEKLETDIKQIYER
jgi:hypothetical protein